MSLSRVGKKKKIKTEEGPIISEAACKDMQVGSSEKILHLKSKLSMQILWNNKKSNPVKVTPCDIKSDAFNDSKIPRISKKNIQLRNNGSLEKGNESRSRHISTERVNG